ncbi:hypothetical protein G7074_21625 [Pedobacter sp. HDW13]|uniref:hypothetical protein n=1 Tax=unclassified Pedobacter TaxID=2628915 RepID=UPI000F5AD16D|nr:MULTISPECIES: hypothetical protein [unclassified Pedobacter]QIL41634.1 hypothetical protein G7074_21625 [Pedobacter sp. HDW13]
MKIQRSSTLAELQSLRVGDHITFCQNSGRIKNIEVHRFRNEHHFYIKLQYIKQTILIIK